jgi:CHAD domain-containing protein
VERKIRLEVPTSLTPEQLQSEVNQRYTTVAEPLANVDLHFYDTFDWRLYRRGLVLCRDEKTYSLLSREATEPLFTVLCNANAKPRFWQDFPPGPLRNQLSSHLGIRALLHLTSIRKRIQAFWVVNQQRQSVLKIALENVWSVHRSEPIFLQKALVIQPIANFRKELQDLRDQMRSLGIEKEASDEFLLALATIDMEPGAYSSKIKVKLEPEMPARLAACKILQQLLQTIQQNEKGICLDIDTEFLHDFRVAVRRTRSAITQMRGVFPPEIIKTYKQRFSVLGRATNRLRDLDVYLLKRDSYQALLVADLRPGLDLVFRTYAAERRQEQAKVVQLLQASDYQFLLQDWDRILTQAAQNELLPGDTSHEPVLLLARRFIQKQHRKVVKACRKIDATTQDQDIHRLRIEAKKLRYLMEFFASLFAPKPTAQLIKELKKVQDSLGDFNDFSLQQVELVRHLQEVKGRSRLSLLHAAALGGLITHLHVKQQAIRADFSRIFKVFSSKETTDLFKQTFGEE